VAGAAAGDVQQLVEVVPVDVHPAHLLTPDADVPGEGQQRLGGVPLEVVVHVASGSAAGAGASDAGIVGRVAVRSGGRDRARHPHGCPRPLVRPGPLPATGRFDQADGMTERDGTPRVAVDGARSGRVTIAEVAARAGVSATTVSHVFSGKRLVSAATRERVMAVVQELGYRPNNVARNLRTRRSRMVAVIVPDITNPYYGVLTRGLADAVEGADYGTYVCNTDGAVARERRFVEDVLDRGVDGVVMGSVTVPPEVITRLADIGTPFVCMGRGVVHPMVDTIWTDDVAGAHEATEHLLAGGTGPVAMIDGPGDTGGRAEGYRDALAAAGAPFRDALYVHGNWTRTGGRDAMRRLLALDERPAAVFCANDLMAIGAMDAAREAGLRIPEDLRLAGFDDIDAATLVSPALTTVRNPSYETGRTAGELLLHRIDGGHRDGARSVVLPGTLVVRGSSALPRP
jgi:LacI family transcriptional regulator